MSHRETTPEVVVIVTGADADHRLDQVIAAHVPGVSRSQAHRLIREGRVTLSEGKAKPALAVWPGLEITIDIPALAPPLPQPEALPLKIVFDDPEFVVIDKPAGMVVHPAAGHRRGTLVNALLHHVRGLSGIGGAERPGIVHRLDKGTSGLIVVAKTDRAHRALSQQFQAREVTKDYIALVWGTLKPGTTMGRPIGRDPRNRKKMSSRARRARPAVTRIESVEPLGGVSLVRTSIGTGRTHQIRVHLSEAGHAVVGDELYGGDRRSLPPRLAAIARLARPFLHATRLAFAHPADGRPVVFDSPLPDDLERVLAALRKASGRTPQESSHGT